MATKTKSHCRSLFISDVERIGEIGSPIEVMGLLYGHESSSWIMGDGTGIARILGIDSFPEISVLLGKKIFVRGTIARKKPLSIMGREIGTAIVT